MSLVEIIAQGFGIIGLLIFVLSFQCKDNKKLVFIQGIGGFSFFLNFMLIGAYTGAFFNIILLIRGLLYTKKEGKIYKLIIVEALLILAFIYAAIQANGEIKQLLLTALPCIPLMIMSVLMRKEMDKPLRYFQLVILSPAWLIHNVFNFTLGGILCEIFNMISVGISLIRYRNK